MTREEIKQVAENYASQMCNDCSARLYCAERNKKCVEFREQVKVFSEGIRWSDAHPKNVWHPVSEEPKNGSHILMQYNDLGDKEYKSFHNEYDEYINWEKLVKIHGISQWAYIKDVLPKK